MLKKFPAFDIEGHRGCRGLLPENSLPAFERALDLGCTTLELDLVITADSQVLVSHEPWFSHEFCSDADGQPIAESEERAHKIYAMSFAEVSKYDCGSRPHPRFPHQKLMPTTKPLLSDVFALGEKSGKKPFYNIEIKRVPEQDGIFHPDMRRFAELVLAEVERSQIQDRIIIQCFDFETLRYVREQAPHIPLAMLVEESKGLADDLQRLGFVPEIYSPYYPLVDAQLVADAHQKNIKVVPWTVNKSAEMQRLIDLKVDGIITDYPDKLVALRKKN